MQQRRNRRLQWHVETESALPAALAEAEQQASSRILSGRDAAAAVRELAAPGQPPGAHLRATAARTPLGWPCAGPA